jgi:hypothetical protein
MPTGMGNQGYSIAATASSSADKELADLGLVPQNAKTSTGLGRMFRGDDKGQYDTDVKNASTGAITKQKVEKFKTDTLPKLKDLVTKLNSTVSAVKSGSSLSQSSGIGLKLPNKPFESSIFESLLKEFQDEVIDQGIEERVVGVDSPGAKLAPEVQQVYDELKALLDTAEKDGIGKDPEMAKELETAKTAMATAEKDGVEKPAAAPATSGGGTGAQSTVATSGDKEAKLKRIKELLAKAKESKAAVPKTAPKTESMSELMNRIQRIAEGTTLSEALTADEYKELQRLAADLGTDFKDDPEIQTLTKQALDLPAQFSSDEKPADPTNPTDPTKPNDKKPGVADPKVQKVQEQLKALGVDPGPIDGRMGPKTVAGIKAFEKLAGLPETGKITPELEKLLADGKNVIARSKLTQSLTAIEALMTKYKITESITVENLESMTEDELRSFVMANIKVFSESEQMSIMKQFIDESAKLDEKFVNGKFYPDSAPDTKPKRSVTGSVDVPKDFGKAPVDSKGNPIRPDYLGNTPGNPAPKTPTPAPAPAPEPGKASWLDKAKGVLNKVGGKVAGAAMRNPRIAAGVAILSTAAAGFGISKFMDWIKGGDLEMDPADLAELQKHLKVLEEFGKNPEVVKGLPVEVQKRLETVLGKLNKLQQAKAKAAPGQNQAAAASNTPPTA